METKKQTTISVSDRKMIKAVFVEKRPFLVGHILRPHDKFLVKSCVSWKEFYDGIDEEHNALKSFDYFQIKNPLSFYVIVKDGLLNKLLPKSEYKKIKC